MRKVIEIRNLSYSYADGIKALENVNLTVHERERVFVIGPNGAGKSTLFSCILGFLKFEGEIIVSGIPVKKETLKNIRSTVGIVFQDPDDQIFMPSVQDDVLFGARSKFTEEEAQANAREAMQTTGLLGLEKRLAHHLSFGEKKRVSIAGVLAMKPDVILLDEPTSNLDHRHRKHLIDTLMKVDGTLVIATHEMRLVCEMADRVVILNQGKILAQGDPRDILTDKRLLETAYLEPPCECELNKLFSRI
ncbi:MAG: energy-coupling factor ABC transporter ATP-binding protein [Actinobacteria bacterium]|nr:energy-coupling factor ABC transporter ATP-binding protein [Actinomycetota bacterium]